MDAFGWMQGVLQGASSDSITCTVTDNSGAQASQVVSVSRVNYDFYPIDRSWSPAQTNLATAFANTAYSSQLHSVSAGTSFTYTQGSSLPPGLTVTASGKVVGTPTLPGNYNFLINGTDSLNNGASTFCQLQVLPQNTVSRPAYNTGTGFFVDGGGQFRDPNGNLFQFRGLNRNHYDSTSWASGASGAAAFPAAVRVFMFDGQTASFAANQITTQYQPNAIFTWLVASGMGTGTSGNTSSLLIAACCVNWLSYEATLAPVMNVMGVNVANEWGPLNSINWQYAYQYCTGAISSVSGTTVTLSTVSATNPFANCPFGYISGGGLSPQIYAFTSPGGSSGAWTVTASAFQTKVALSGSGTTWTATLATPVTAGTVFVYDNTGRWALDDGAGNLTNGSGVSTGTINYASGAILITWTGTATSTGCHFGQGSNIVGYTSGGTLYGGALGVLRGSGYTCPVLIDTGKSGQDPWDIVNYAQAVNASDPQKNCVFAYHSYGLTTTAQASIASVTLGNPTVLTLNTGTLTYNPFGQSSSTTNPFYGNNGYTITGALGLTSLNGSFVSNTNTYGSGPGNWQLHLNVDSTGWTGSYVANSATVTAYSNPSGPNFSAAGQYDYRTLYSNLAALKSVGVCAAVMEFGPGNQSGSPTGSAVGPSPTDTAVGQIVSSAEANGLPWCYWAWDDHSTNLGFNPNWFNVVQGNNGVFTSNSSFTAGGQFVVGNPRYGTWTLAQEAPYLQAVNPQTLPLVQTSTPLFTFLGSFKLPNIYQGGSFATSAYNGVMYMGGTYHYGGNTAGQFGVGRVIIPTLTGAPAYDGSNGLATADAGPGNNDGPSRPGYPTFTAPGPAWPWGSAQGDAICGSLFYPTNGNLYLTGAISYASSGQLGWILKANANCDPTSWGAINGIAGKTNDQTRAYAGPMGLIPSIWQPLLGGPAFAAPGKSVSLIATLNIGAGFSVFDPTTVSAAAGNSVSVTDLLHYPEQVAPYKPNTTMLSWRSFTGPYPIAYQSTPNLYPSGTVSVSHPSSSAIPKIGDTSLTLTAAVPTSNARYTGASPPTGVGVVYGAAAANSYWPFLVYFDSGEKRLCLLKGGDAAVPTTDFISNTYVGSNPTVFLDPVTLQQSPLTQNCTGSTIYYAPLGDNYYSEYDNGALQPFIAPGSRSLVFPMVHSNGFLSPPPQQGFPGCYVGGSNSDDAPIAPDTNYYITMQALAYDLNDLVAVKQGSKNPWTPNPYAILPWDNIAQFGLQTQSGKPGPYCLAVGPGLASAGAGCFDPVTNRYYLGVGALSRFTSAITTVYVWQVNSL
jgi:hypothetical protein